MYLEEDFENNNDEPIPSRTLRQSGIQILSRIDEKTPSKFREVARWDNPTLIAHIALLQYV
jgi:hypothetical protein